jgi:hypothetical protein
MVQTMPAESGGKSWLKEISGGQRVFRRIFPARGQPHQQKTPPPLGEAAFCSIMTRKEELLCPWQAWQRPTLPGLKP